MTDTDIVPTGTLVEYHGSLIDYHGPMTVMGSHDEWGPTGVEAWATRYTLSGGLSNVRRESFTVINTEDGHS